MTIDIVHSYLHREHQFNDTTNDRETNVKRNLFGRLNHDLLSKDLQTMWMDTINRQNSKWNFDFQQLCPINCVDHKPYYEWTQTPIDDIQIPDFYKISCASKRRSNLNPNNNNNNKSSRSPSLTRDDNNNNNKKQTNIDLNCNNKRTPKRKTNTNQMIKNSLILTYSENRKDTLRSATTTPTPTNKRTRTSAQNKDNSKQQSYKQQTLLDMLQQRKKRSDTTDKNENEINLKRFRHNNRTSATNTQINMSKCTKTN